MSTEPESPAAADGQDAAPPVAGADGAGQDAAGQDAAGQDAAGRDAGGQDDKADLKAKFREALAHKGRHDNPEGGVDATRHPGGETHGPASGKRTFRRKTG